MIEAADGAVAMQIAVAHEGVIHLLLTDVIMPGMNGRELAQRISEIRPNVKVLYMSGYTENVIGHNGMLDAGVRLLQKPFNLRDLKSKVREVLDSTPTPPEVAMSSSIRSATPRRASARNRRPSRAQRFQLHLPLRYRRLGEKNWHVGTTEKHQPLRHALPGRRISCNPTRNWKSIWCCRRRLPASRPLKSSAAEKSSAPCSSDKTEMPPALAARILQYHFQHGGPLPRA